MRAFICSPTRARCRRSFKNGRSEVRSSIFRASSVTEATFWMSRNDAWTDAVSMIFLSWSLDTRLFFTSWRADPVVASYLRIDERELEAGGLN
jgi:hypothetical protein